MLVKDFSHVGKVYCLNIGDSFYVKCGMVLHKNYHQYLNNNLDLS